MTELTNELLPNQMEDLDEERETAIATLQSVAFCNRQEATTILESHSWDLDVAVNRLFEPHEPHPVPIPTEPVESSAPAEEARHHRFFFPLAMVGLFLALMCTGGCYQLGPTIVGRLLRNPFCSKDPLPLAPIYNACTTKELEKLVTVVVTVKDTCTQAVLLLTHLATMLPRGMPVVYVYPGFVGCRSVNPLTGLFRDFTVKTLPPSASPIRGFLEARELIKTPYALLMHNDAYPMDHQAVCELLRALEAHPEAAFAAPQLYERSENGIAVPHGHHKNLHVRPSSANTETLSIHYDIDFDLLTQRRTKDFDPHGYPQMDFMEDHAYMGRTDTYHLYLDSAASFTMEYIDSILAMRANDSFPWYVPTARVVFDVDIHKVGWRDIPYFVHKRSEEIGLEVRAYLSQKWGVEFPNTGIWNYVRYSFLCDVLLDDNALPSDWESQAALYYSWFHSIGFNRYNGHTLHDTLHGEHMLPLDGKVFISRNTRIAPTDATPQAKTAADILPYEEGHKLINITLVNESIPIALSVSSECHAAKCGMLVLDGGSCYCVTYVSPYELGRDYGMTWLLDRLKLPSRTVKFVQMKHTSNAQTDRFLGASVHCFANNPDCHIVAPAFSKTARLVQWSWFGSDGATSA